MKSLLLSLFVVSSFVACQQTNQVSANSNQQPSVVVENEQPISTKSMYVYTEHATGYDKYLDVESYPDVKIIEALDDSIAYSMALDTFLMDLYAIKRVKAELKARGIKNIDDYKSSPKSFSLFKEDGTDLSKGSHLSNPEALREKKEKSYKEMLAKYPK